MNKIGGEFEFDTDLLNKPFNNPVETFYCSGRSALKAIIHDILNNKKAETIFMPNYLCESITETIKLFPLKIEYYPVDNTLMPYLDSIKEKLTKSSILFTINYFGLLHLDTMINDLKTEIPGLTIIEDNVQAYWEMDKELNADYSFTSLRKTFPLHEGAFIRSKAPISSPGLTPNRFAQFKWIGSLMKSWAKDNPGINDAEYLKLFEEGEKLLDKSEQFPMGVSHLFTRYYNHLDISACRKQRIENTTVLTSCLREFNIEPMLRWDTKKTPLFIPLLLPDRDRIRKALFKESIFLPVHWPGYSEISQRELSLVVDHRYNSEDMIRQAAALKKAIDGVL